MTVSSTLNRISYNGNDVTVNFAVSFPFQAKADLVVLSIVIATGVQTTKALTTDYTISGTPDTLGFYPNGGTVTMLVAPASTERLTIYRDPARTQGLDLVENDNLPAESVEAQFDYIIMLLQRLADLVARSARQPDGDSASMGTLPSKVDRASMYLGFNSAGDPIALAAPTNTSLTTPYTQTLLDDADADAVLATLGLPHVEGTWTLSVGGNATYTSRVGKVFKYGRLVFITGSMQINVLGTGSTTTLSGLPYAASSACTFNVSDTSGLAVTPVSLSGLVASGATNITFPGRTAANAASSNLAIFGNGALVEFSGFYCTAS